MHGRLGGLLHHAFFRQNKWWFLDIRREAPSQTLLDVRDFLTKVCDELAEATRGSLLTHPEFTALVDEVLSEP